MIPVDQAFFESEQRWGVGRLERLVSPATLAAYQRGWAAYRVALDDCDGAAVKRIGPRMVQALAVMAAEADGGRAPAARSGHLGAPPTWATGLVLCVVRTSAEGVGPSCVPPGPPGRGHLTRRRCCRISR